MKKKKMSDAGEFAFIDIIRKRFSKNFSKNVIAPIGDDAFCFKAGNETVCVTKDMLVEDVHFEKGLITPAQLGQKAAEVNISDIASMGTITPKYAFIGLGCPAGITLDYVQSFYAGFKKACDADGVLISGGDTVRSDKLIISVTVVGTCKTRKVIRRNGAKNGDLVGVTNAFGDSGAGLELLLKRGARDGYTKAEKKLIAKHNVPKARLKEANKISKYASSMTDASDGLYVSVNLLAKESAKGADIDIEKIPLSSELKSVIKDEAKRFDLALFGAEDYELVFTVPKFKAKAVKKLVPRVSYIGEINNSKKVRYFHNGKEKKVKYSGFSHF